MEELKNMREESCILMCKYTEEYKNKSFFLFWFSPEFCNVKIELFTYV